MKHLTANEIIWAKELIKVARKQNPWYEGQIEYKKLDGVTGTMLYPSDRQGRPFNEVSGEMLGNISIYCDSIGLPLISVIVVGGGKVEPSPGFYNISVDKMPKDKSKREAFMFAEMNAVWNADWSILEIELNAINNIEVKAEKSFELLTQNATRKITMPKNSAKLNEIEPALEIYYNANNWLESGDYMERIKNAIGGGKGNDEYPKIENNLSYFGFTERQTLGASNRYKRITILGKKMWEAIDIMMQLKNITLY